MAKQVNAIPDHEEHDAGGRDAKVIQKQGKRKEETYSRESKSANDDSMVKPCNDSSTTEAQVKSSQVKHKLLQEDLRLDERLSRRRGSAE